MKDIKTTNFFNDVKRVLSWGLNKSRKTNLENSRVRSFFSRIWREMKR